MLQEILDFLGKSPAFYVATTDESGAPRVRPFGFVMEWNGKLAFCTNTTKPTYRQLKNNPAVEVCSFDVQSGKWMRISGTVEFTDAPEAKKKVFEVMPALRKMYADEQDPVIVCFWIEKGEAAIYSFASMNEPERVISL